MPGQLVFRPIEANLNLKDKDLLGKMDPYCLFHVGGHRVKSQVCQNGGQNPHWNDSITCDMPQTGGVVQVDLKDKDMLIDDKLGTFELDLNEVANLGQVRKWYPIFSKDRPAGEILIETTFNGSGMGQGFGQQYGGQQGMGQQYGGQQNFTNQQFVGGIPTTQSTTMTRVVPTGGQTVLSEIHTGHQQQGLTQQIPHQHVPQQNFQQAPLQSTSYSGGQPLQFSGMQANVIPVGGIPGSVEQYATEALMRGVDPMNTQQHYQYNVLNGSTKPGFTGIPMNYSTGNSGQILNQTPGNLTQTPLYSGSQPLQYEGDEGHAARLANTHTTGHHNEGFMSKLQQKEQNLEQKFSHHGKHTDESKNLKTGDFRNV